MSESPATTQTSKLDAIFIINIVSLVFTFISTVILGLKLRMRCCCGEISMKGKDNTSKDSPSPAPAAVEPKPVEREVPHVREPHRSTPTGKRNSLEKSLGHSALKRRRPPEDASPAEEEEEDDEEQESPEAAASAIAMPMAPHAADTGSTKSGRPSSVILKQTKDGGLVIEKTADVTVEILPPTPVKENTLTQPQ